MYYTDVAWAAAGPLRWKALPDRKAASMLSIPPRSSSSTWSCGPPGTGSEVGVSSAFGSAAVGDLPLASLASSAAFCWVILAKITGILMNAPSSQLLWRQLLVSFGFPPSLSVIIVRVEIVKYCANIPGKHPKNLKKCWKVLPVWQLVHHII